MGFLVALVAMVLVFVLLLPLIGSIYYDTLAAQKESKMQIERMERLRQQLEYERQIYQDFGKYNDTCPRIQIVGICTPMK